ncbi:unnamed protein product [Moneuplotes crassus]|uniref:Uncharacterized protein n=1 Tax=Euplotes crassus TaxID=5936 RepID=A0AAD1XGF1_EUPCR|nr:unnamed protein product [Moneuplotes crassus]
MSFNTYKEDHPTFSSSNSFTKPSYTNSVDQFNEIKSLIKKIHRKEANKEGDIYFSQTANSFISLEPPSVLGISQNNRNRHTVLEKEDADVPEFYFSLTKTPSPKKRLMTEKRRIRKNEKYTKLPYTRREKFKPNPRYKINLPDLNKKAMTSRKQNGQMIVPQKLERTQVVYETPKKFRSHLIDNHCTDLADYKEEVPIPMNNINNTIKSKNIQEKDIEMIKIDPKSADTSLAYSSSQASDIEFIPPPEVKNDKYEDAFRGKQMGPHSKSFVSFNSPEVKAAMSRKNQLVNPDKVKYTNTKSKRFDYKLDHQEVSNEVGPRTTNKKLLKKPKSRIMLPKRVETYEDVIKRLYDSKSPSNG